MARKSIGKPRFYADVLQYIKAMGYAEDWDSGYQQLDPTSRNQYTANAISTLDFNIDQPLSNNRSIDKLIYNIPQSSVSGLYAGILGHDYNQDIELKIQLEPFNNATPTIEQSEATEIVNWTNNNIDKIGYSLWSIDGWNNEISYDISPYGYINNVQMATYAAISHSARVGAVTYGRWFEPEYAFDLKATRMDSYEGIKTQNTIGGNTLTNIKYTGQPNWIDEFPAWSLIKHEDEEYNYKLTNHRPRRQWNVGFSFLSDDKLFNKAGNPDQFFTYDEDAEGSNTYTFDDSLSSFFKLTLNGNLPFIFCPDNDADDKEFALCRITNKPQFKQVANNLWGTSLVLTETW